MSDLTIKTNTGTKMKRILHKVSLHNKKGSLRASLGRRLYYN